MPSGKAARWLLHTVLLFTVMAAPFFLLRTPTAGLAAVCIGSMYLLWGLVSGFLRLRGASRQPLKVRMLLAALRTFVPGMVLGLMLVLLIVWAVAAYWPLMVSRGATASAPAIILGWSVIVVGPLLVLGGLTLLIAWKDGGVATRLQKGILARGFGRFHGFWLHYTAFVAGSFCLASVFLAPAWLHRLVLLRDSDGNVTLWEFMAVYPFLPIALLIAAAIFSLERMGPHDDALVSAYVDAPVDKPVTKRIHRPALGVLITGVCVAALLFIVYPLHLRITAKAAADGARTMKGAYQALANLYNSREKDDWTGPEYIAAVNRVGFWVSELPKAGLATLVEDPGQLFAETCTVRVAAGFIHPASRADAEWLTESEASSSLRFCIAVTCAPPFTWNATPALLLSTSHSSRGENWRDKDYADIFAEGRAAAPGGYCTAEGKLADTYQG